MVTAIFDMERSDMKRRDSWRESDDAGHLRESGLIWQMRLRQASRQSGHRLHSLFRQNEAAGRKVANEFAAFVHRTTNLQRGAVFDQHMLDDGEAEAGAAGTVVAAGIDAVEAFGQAGDV